MSKQSESQEKQFESQRGGFKAPSGTVAPGAKALIMLLLILMLVFLITLLLKQHQPTSAPVDNAQTSGRPVSSLPNVEFSQTIPAEEPPPQAPSVPAEVVQPPAEDNSAWQEALQRRLSSPLAEQHTAGEANNEATLQPGSNAAPVGNQLDKLLTPATMVAASASRIKNRSLKILRGTFIPCGLINELNTTVNGMIACRVTRDVYSADGLVRLIDKGAMLDGQVNTALKDGQKRVFVVWQRLVSNDGVQVELNSPGTNQVGGAGIPGQVDTLFWQRFKSAILISLLDDAMTALVNTTQRGNVANFGNTTGSSNEIVSAVLPATIDIPPILETHQGAAVGVYVARDLDFSKVFALSGR